MKNPTLSGTDRTSAISARRPPPAVITVEAGSCLTPYTLTASARPAMWSARNFVSRGFLDGSYSTTEGCSAAPNMGWRVRPTPGAEGTALLMVGQKPTRRRSAWSRPACLFLCRSSRFSMDLAGFVPKNVLTFFCYETLGAATTGRALALLAAPRQIARNRFQQAYNEARSPGKAGSGFRTRMRKWK
jgi:hypothetical protein